MSGRHHRSFEEPPSLHALRDIQVGGLVCSQTCITRQRQHHKVQATAPLVVQHPYLRMCAVSVCIRSNTAATVSGDRSVPTSVANNPALRSAAVAAAAAAVAAAAAAVAGTWKHQPQLDHFEFCMRTDKQGSLHRRYIGS
jgi:hypothetical protein